MKHIVHELPDCLKHCIAPALTAEASGPLWKTQGNELYRHKDWDKYFYKLNADHKAEAAIRARSGYVLDMSARQYMHLVRDSGNLQKWDLPTRCQEEAPDDITVYTDGSLINSRCHWWHLGGFGVWWPGRKIEDRPLTEQETTASYHKVTKAGVGLWGALTGHRCSSTRTEIAGGIVAASAQGPQHQGTDSQSYLSKLRKLLRGDVLTAKRPWSIQSNGDLWQFHGRQAQGSGHIWRLHWRQVQGYEPLGHGHLRHLHGRAGQGSGRL